MDLAYILGTTIIDYKYEHSGDNNMGLNRTICTVNRNFNIIIIIFMDATGGAYVFFLELLTVTDPLLIDSI